MTTFTFSLPDDLAAYIRSIAQTSGYPDADSYLKDLILESLREKQQKILDEKIREGMNTRSIPVEEGHWEKLRERLNRMADELLENADC